nr:PREDICTED: uncharacterized protein LOC109035058 [Bemisia tabaci]
MATPSSNTAWFYRSLNRFLFQLMTSLLIATVLESGEIQGWLDLHDSEEAKDNLEPAPNPLISPVHQSFFMDMETRELYNLYNWRDICDTELMPRQSKKSKWAVRGHDALEQFCKNAFKGWEALKERELMERCPKAQDPGCRPLDGKTRCTVRIRYSNTTDKMKIVSLKYCSKGIDWEGLKPDAAETQGQWGFQ